MTSLCIGGGSYKGFCIIGALDYLYKKNYLTVLKNLYGTSIGAIIGVLFIIGFKPLDILLFFLEMDFKSLWDFNLNNLNETYSLINNIFFKKCLISFFEKYEKKDITIKEFIKKYNININIYAVSLKKKILINFNSQEYENIKVIDALLATSAIPILLPPIIINNEFFVDGCLKCADGVKDYIKDGYTIRIKYPNNEINNLSDYLLELITTGINSCENIESNINTLDIQLPIKFINKYNFNDIKDSDKIELYYEGLKQAQDFYK